MNICRFKFHSQEIASNESEPVMADDIDRQLSFVTTGSDSFKVLRFIAFMV